ncbi:MAG: gamma-glutamyltransferase [Acidobacteria bacterium]|nr:gamma-glutamyltransferase [Acidobacteriota bacterium]
MHHLTRRAGRGPRPRGIRIVAATAASWLVFPATLLAAVRPAPSAPHAMVATPEPTAARVALDILRAGGNAVDAAVATGFALAVTYPQAGNLAGGGFLLARMADGRVLVVDYRETAPAAARRDMFLDASGKVKERASTEGALSVGVPGSVAGLALARDLAGTIPLDRLLAPAIDLAGTGFPVPDGLADDLAESSARLMRNPAASAIFFPDGRAPAPGQVLVQKDLAKCLSRIAREGPRAFYEGEIASAFAATMKRGGGILTSEDLARYRAARREPIRDTYRGLDVISVPPPSSGGALLVEMLHMLEPFDVKGMGAGSSAYEHLAAEVMKRAYADRAEFMGDPDFVRIPLAGLLSRDYSKRSMATFDPQRATPARDAGPGKPSFQESGSTTHFTIADAMGNVVTNTYTLNRYFGNGEMVDGWGFFLNDEMDDFSVAPGEPNLYGLVGGEANAVGPNRRMLSTMTPAILLKDGRPYLALGTPGGSRIATMVLRVIVNVVDFGMDLQAAVDAPRCHHQWLPDRISCERDALSADVAEALRKRGHEIAPTGMRGDIQAILFDGASGALRGASDARGYGAAVGY